jgi:hypothetical protein
MWCIRVCMHTYYLYTCVSSLCRLYSQKGLHLFKIWCICVGISFMTHADASTVYMRIHDIHTYASITTWTQMIHVPMNLSYTRTPIHRPHACTHTIYTPMHPSHTHIHSTLRPMHSTMHSTDTRMHMKRMHTYASFVYTYIVHIHAYIIYIHTHIHA